MKLLHKRAEGARYRLGVNVSCNHWCNVDADEAHVALSRKKFWFGVVLCWNWNGTAHKAGLRYRHGHTPRWLPMRESNSKYQFKW